MTRRIKKSKSIFAPMAENFVARISNTNARHRRKYLKIGMWFLVLIVGYSLVNGDYGFPRIFRLELEKSALIEENRELVAIMVDAVRQKKMLTNNSEYIEYIARTKYFMSYPGETIYRFSGR